jgi:hypothetical protein
MCSLLRLNADSRHYRPRRRQLGAFSPLDVRTTRPTGTAPRFVSRRHFTTSHPGLLDVTARHRTTARLTTLLDATPDQATPRTSRHSTTTHNASPRHEALRFSTPRQNASRHDATMLDGASHHPRPTLTAAPRITSRHVSTPLHNTSRPTPRIASPLHTARRQDTTPQLASQHGSTLDVTPRHSTTIRGRHHKSLLDVTTPRTNSRQRTSPLDGTSRHP